MRITYSTSDLLLLDDDISGAFHHTKYDKHVVGMLVYCPHYSILRGRLLYLKNFVVDEPWRERKIGSQLFARLKQVARDQGYQGIVWTTASCNEAAIHFYNHINADYNGETMSYQILF